MANIGKIKLRPAELQKSNKVFQKIRAKSLNRYKKVNRVLHHQELLFMPKIISTELINRYHDNFLVSSFGINKTRKLISRKYY